MEDLDWHIDNKIMPRFTNDAVWALGVDKLDLQDLLDVSATVDTRRGVYVDVVVQNGKAVGIYVGSGSGKNGISKRFSDYRAGNGAFQRGTHFDAVNKPGMHVLLFRLMPTLSHWL
jgi:hypothetical protein